MRRGLVFCRSCNDYVYDAELDRLLAAERRAVAAMTGGKCTADVGWTATEQEAQVLRAHSTQHYVDRDSTLGASVRGAAPGPACRSHR